MKTFASPLTGIAFFLAAFLYSGCTSQVEQPIHLAFRLEDPADAPLTLVLAENQIGYRDYLAAIDTIPLAADSLCVFDWTATQPGFYLVLNAEGWPLLHDLYLRPGDSLLVSKPADREQPLRYEGALASFYPFFQEHAEVAWGDSLMKERYDQRYEMSPDTFRRFMEDRRAALLKVFEKYAPSIDLESPLLDYAQTYIDYDYASGHYDYLQYHNYYANDTFLYFVPDSTFYAFRERPGPDPAQFPFSYRYTEVVAGKIEDHFQQEVRDLPDSLKWELAMEKKGEIVRNALTGVDRDFGFLALANEFTFYMEKDGFFDWIRELQTFMEEHHTLPVQYRKFAHLVDRVQTLEPGQPAPPLILPDLNGREVSLDDFRGKAVYLDFWGTWCYPCLQEMPHSLELQEKFKDRSDLAFVYIALEYDEEDIDRWRKFVGGEMALSYAPFLEKQVFPGTHLVADRQFHNPAVKPFLVNYAPTYMLIDREGKIVRARAPRPSSGEEIERLLEEVAVAK